MSKQEIIYKNVKDLIPYVNNTRTHDEKQVKQIAASIKEFGFTNPVLVGESNDVIAGHGRILAAEKLGIEQVPTIELKGLSEAQKKAYIIADNKLALNAGWDEDLLKIELEGLKELDFDLSLIGFSFDELDELLDEKVNNDDIIEDDYDENKEVDSIVKHGDVWQLGSHKLMCGDSFSIEQISKLMGDHKADIGFCDPPYDLDKDEWISNLSFVKSGSPILLMAGDKQTVRLANKIPDFRQFIIHDRENAMLVNPSTPMSQHTVISLFCDHPKKYFVNLHDHFTSVIKCKKNYQSADKDMGSKMGKPVKVIADLISHYSKKEDIVMDLFGGGGSTIIACEQLNEVCFMNELDPVQCDRIIDRWQMFTQKKAEKLN